MLTTAVVVKLNPSSVQQTEGKEAVRSEGVKAVTCCTTSKAAISTLLDDMYDVMHPYISVRVTGNAISPIDLQHSCYYGLL